MNIHENMKALRESKGLSMSKAAEALGVPKSTYSSYEYGTREPNIELIIKIASLYSVTTDTLLGKDPQAPPPNPLDSLNTVEEPDISEKNLLESYFSLKPKDRAAFLRVLVDVVKKGRAKRE